MKTTKTKIKNAVLCLILASASVCAMAQNQAKQTVAVLNIDSKGIIHNSETMGYMVRLELEKAGVYAVMDKYEVADAVAKNKIDVNECYSKSCLVEAGKLLGANKMISGSVERFAEKIVITLRLFDVQSGSIEKSDATEYLNLQPEAQKMVEISVRKLLGLPNDQNKVNLLIDYDVPIESPKTSLRLNGPRMGASMTTGDALKVLTASKEQGGFDMFPVTSQFGFQLEQQYMSAGNFQALVEEVFLIGGLESGKIIPSANLLLGFRFGKAGWEFAFGPTFRFVKKADGYYDYDGDWNLKNDWKADSTNNFSSTPGYYDENGQFKNYEIQSRLDSRGDLKLSTGLVLAVGRTFKSGYLNIPVNVYVAPRPDGTTVGASFGFNIQKKRMVE